MKRGAAVSMASASSATRSATTTSSASTRPAAPASGPTTRQARDILPVSPGAGGIGTPEEIAVNMQRFEDAGVDQVVFLQQGGRNEHAHICASLELFAGSVMPAFKARHAARAAKRTPSLRPTSRGRWPARRGGSRWPMAISRPSSPSGGSRRSRSLSTARPPTSAAAARCRCRSKTHEEGAGVGRKKNRAFGPGGGIRMPDVDRGSGG